MFCVVNDQV